MNSFMRDVAQFGVKNIVKKIFRDQDSITLAQQIHKELKHY